MKNNKGINLIALIVMIIVMIILATIAIKTGTDAYQNALKTKGAEERKQVEYAISDRFGDYQRNETANPLVGFIIPDEDIETEAKAKNYLISKFKGEYGKLATDDEIQNNTVSLKNMETGYQETLSLEEATRILIYSDLIDLGVENTNLNAIYLVNYYSNDVVGPIN